MSNPCSCDAGKSNIQKSKCKNLEQIARRLVLVPEYKNDGTKFEWATVSLITKANMIAAMNAASINDRIFPLAYMEQVEEMRAESDTQEFNSGNLAKIDDGKREFTGFIPYGDPILVKKLKAWGCQKFGLLEVDKNGNISYYTDKTTELKVQPFLVDENSWDVIYVKAKDKEVPGIMIKFKYRTSVDDAYRRLREASDLDFDALEELYSLYDVSSTITAISATGFTVELKDEYGLAVQGLEESDFAVYNTTDLAPVTITGAPETSAGVYAFTFASQTSADVLRLTPTENGYDFSLVVANLITI